MSAIESAVRYALAQREPFKTVQVSHAAKLNCTTTGHVLRALAAAGLVADAGRAGWKPRQDLEDRA